MLYLHFLAGLLLVALDVHAAEECPSIGATCGDWQTIVRHPGGTMRLHWTHVYEGRDTVHKVEFFQSGRCVGSLKVNGQPVFNPLRSLVAFPYCADDGCSSAVEVVDLARRRVRSTVKLPYQAQIDLRRTWRDEVLVVRVESFENGQRTLHNHEFNLATSKSAQ